MALVLSLPLMLPFPLLGAEIEGTIESGGETQIGFTYSGPLGQTTVELNLAPKVDVEIDRARSRSSELKAGMPARVTVDDASKLVTAIVPFTVTSPSFKSSPRLPANIQV